MIYVERFFTTLLTSVTCYRHYPRTYFILGFDIEYLIPELIFEKANTNYVVKHIEKHCKWIAKQCIDVGGCPFEQSSRLIVAILYEIQAI